MATAFDFANIAMLSLLTYARETYGDTLTLDELADTIEADSAEFFEGNEVAEQDQMLSTFAATAIANSFRELSKSGYDLEDVLSAVTNVLPEEALNDLESEEDDEDGEEEELDEDEDEDEDDEDDEDDDEELDEDDEEDDEELDEDDEEDDEELDEDEEEDDDLDEDEDEGNY